MKRFPSMGSLGPEPVFIQPSGKTRELVPGISQAFAIDASDQGNQQNTIPNPGGP
jgi:hypothetical protein